MPTLDVGSIGRETTARRKYRPQTAEELGDHDVVTGSYMGWSGLKNGELLRIAEDSGIEVFLTGDHNLAQEQNLSGRRIAVVMLSAIEWPIIKNSVAQILAAVNDAVPGSFQAVDLRRVQPEEADVV